MRQRTHGQAGIDEPRPGEQWQPWVRQPRRGTSGPRPVRPPVPPGSARPEGGPRPVPAGIVADEAGSGPPGRALSGRGVGSAATARAGARGLTADGVPLARRMTVVSGPRLLVRSPVLPVSQSEVRVRRIVAGFAVALVAAAVVFGLGRVADAASQARGPAAHVVAEVTVTVDAPGTVWDVVDGVAPSAPGPERAAMVDRVVVVNSLTSVEVWPGEVLRVPLR
jgi:hypothetical protein